MADTLDLLTLTEAKLAAGYADTDRDAEFAAWVTAVSRFVDELCGPVVQRTVTGELHDGGCSSIWLREVPVSSVTSVTEYSGTTATVLTEETIGTAPAAGFLLYDELSGEVFRRAGGYDYNFASGRRNVTVTYVAGRAASTAAVDERFKQAAGVILQQLWQSSGMGTDTFGPPEIPVGFALPNRARELLFGELKPSGVA